MAITKEVVIDRHEVVGEYKHIQCREATIIKEDGTIISRSFNRRVLSPDEDVSGESQETQNICAAVWTDAVKAEWEKNKGPNMDFHSEE